jgi:hypothetical protein
VPHSAQGIPNLLTLVRPEAHPLTGASQHNYERRLLDRALERFAARSENLRVKFAGLRMGKRFGEDQDIQP